MIRKLFRNRWFLLALLFLAIALLIWFVGEGVAIFDFRPLESPAARWTLIALTAVAWAAWEVAKRLRARRANRKLLEGIAGESADPSTAQSAAEIAMLRKRFEDAAAILRKARFGGEGGQFLYQLPWYVFIGAPGSGKTTALTNCGLRFPLTESGAVEAVRGIGGTRNCDWWFTDEAVFLDTAGRYATQESDAKVDGAAWLGFLDLLRRFRPKRPLNGAIITLSIGDLLSSSESERNRYAAIMRQRVQELYERLGVRFPVYLMVTKSDLLAGFMEFFGDLGREDRAQVWGITFDNPRRKDAPPDFVAAFDGEFADLERRLNARLLDRIQQERDPQRRALLYTFPQQFSLLGPLVSSFIDQAFRGSRFEEQAMLRGVYFTSGTQEGTPIDRVLATLSQNFRLERRVLPPSAASGKSFFLTRLLKEVVFPEAGLAGINERRERIVRWIVRGAFAGIALVSTVLVAGWAVSYYNNRALVDDMDARVKALAPRVQALPAPRRDDIATILPLLDELRDLPYGHREHDRAATLGTSFGLFQGDKLGAEARDTYRRVLRDAFLPRLALRLEDQIRHPATPDLRYEALKMYLMLFDEQHLDAQALETWIAADWGRLLSTDRDTTPRDDLVGHARASLERRPLALRFQRDDALVAEARRALATTSLPDRVYARMKLIGADATVTPFRVSDGAGPSAAQVFVRPSGAPLSAPTQSLFTREGYFKAFRPQLETVAQQMASEESWVLGPEAYSATGALTPPQLVEEVRSRYLEEYARQWDALLADIQLKPSASLADTQLYARVLAGRDSPLRKLAVAISRETSLTPREEDNPKALAEKATDAVMDVTKKALGKILGGTPAAGGGAQAGGAAPEARVDDHFADLHQLTATAGPDKPMALDALIALLNDFHDELATAATAMRSGGALVTSLPTATKLAAEAERLPPPLQGIVRGLLSNTSGQAAAANQQNMQKAISGAASFCEKAVAGRYPVTRNGKSEITVEDFGAVFAPGGDLDQFFTKNLQATVDTSGPVWRVRAGSEAAIPVSAAAIRQFQNADVIRRAFFRAGAQPVASADLVLLSTDIPQVALDYDGETQRFIPGQTTAARVRWPSQKPAPTAKLSLPTGQPIVAEGTWALFRLFDRATAEPGSSPERVKLTFQIDGRIIVFELRATSVFNPFFLRELSGFQCPGGR